MDKGKERLSYLWEQYLNKSASPAELEELFAELKKPESETFSRSVLEQYFGSDLETAGGKQVPFDKTFWLSKLAAIKESAQTDAVKGKAKTDAIKEKAQKDTTREKPQIDATKEKALINAIKDKTQTDAIKENAQTDAIKENAQTDSTKEKTPVLDINATRPRWPRYAAAAAAIFIGIASYFYFGNHKSSAATTEIAKAKSNEVIPGSAKAILTLADSKQIILDSAATGELAKQGNTEITKTAPGEVAYNESKEKPEEILMNTLTVPRGGTYQLSLPDGTKVWLNAASSITYPTAFTGKERKVTVTGEVYFEVVHNNAKPFRVGVNGTEIEDVGTHFNINAYADESAVKTTLIEGAVKINRNGSAVLLKPGQQALVTTDPRIKVLNDVNIENVISWKEGKFRYTSEDIESIMRQVARWYDVEIVYRGKFSETFSGGIPRQESITEFLKLLGYSATTLKFEIDGKRIIVEPK